MEELIKIRCPFCSTALTVKRIPDIEKKSVTCPVCKQKSPFKDFTQTFNADSETNYGNPHSNKSYDSENSQNSFGENSNSFIGELINMDTGDVYQLQPGKNVIGRKATSSKATIQIPTGDNKRISREHLVIDVRRVAGKGYVHYISLYKKETNKTIVGTSQLLYGEELALKNMQLIDLPELTLMFQIQDNEGTII